MCIDEIITPTRPLGAKIIFQVAVLNRSFPLWNTAKQTGYCKTLKHLEAGLITQLLSYNRVDWDN